MREISKTTLTLLLFFAYLSFTRETANKTVTNVNETQPTPIAINQTIGQTQPAEPPAIPVF